MARVKLLSFGLSLALIIWGCEKKSDAGLRFDMEKQLAQADELKQRMIDKGQPLTSAEFDSLFAAYGKVVKAIKATSDSVQIARASAERKQAWNIAALAQTRIGLLYLDKRDYAKAFESFKRVYDNPITTPVQRNAVKSYLAIAKEKGRDYKAAARLYAELAQEYLPLVVPQNPNMDALGGMIKSAELYRKAGDYVSFDTMLQRAREYYGRLEKEYPGTQVANVAIGKRIAAYLQQDKYKEAIAALELVRDDSIGGPPPQILLMIGEIQMNNLKDFYQAENTYRRFIKAFPNDPRLSAAKIALGLCLYEQKRYADARNAVKEMEGRQSGNPMSIEADYLMALCYEKEGQWDRALAKLNFIQATYPGSEKGFESALYIANYYKQKGDHKLSSRAFSQAEEYIKKYTDPATSNPAVAARAQGYLVRCYLEMENFQAAVAALKTLHEKFPKTTEGMFAPLKLADLYENIIGDKSQAAEWLRIFAEKNPDSDNIDEINAHIKALLN